MENKFAKYPELLDKRVLVTGGSRGIGRSIVEAFAENGCKVFFLYEKNDDAADEVARATKATAIKCDISDPAAVSALSYEFDIVVNNAAVSKIGLFTDMSDDEWSHILGVNLSGAFYVARRAVKQMISQGYGRIINIGSMWGKTGASCEVAYSATKGAIRSFTMALAKELGPSNITVNCIEPGVIDTEMNASIGEETLAQLAEETPLCRIGKPEDVANAVLFLASDGASFITGQIIGVDGGYAV